MKYVQNLYNENVDNRVKEDLINGKINQGYGLKDSIWFRYQIDIFLDSFNTIPIKSLHDFLTSWF